MIRVLVFPSSNEPGLEIVRSLIDQPGLEVHGGSCYEPYEDASASILKRHARFPVLGSREFRGELEAYIRKEKIDIVYPSMESMVTEFSTWKMDGVKFIAQRPEVAAVVESKKETYRILAGIIPLPEVYQDSVPDFPVYAKPPDGSGGRGHMVVNNTADLEWARAQGLLITEYLTGGEIVAYNVGGLDGSHLLCITKTMGRWRGGASQLGFLKDDPVVRGHAAAIAEKIKLVGSWFAQFKQDRHGNYKLMEVNARPGGAIGICRYGGNNIPLLTVKVFSGQPLDFSKHTRNISWVRNLRPFLSMAPFDTVIWSLSAFTRPIDGKLRPHTVSALFDLSNRNIVQHCYGGIDPSFADWNLPNHFKIRHATLKDALGSIRHPSKTIIITNDSSERKEVGDSMPELRLLTSDALDALGGDRM